MSGSTRWFSLAHDSDLVAVACQRILSAARQAIAARGRFLLVLTGGNTPRAVYRQMAGIETDWSNWHFYLGDERCLPADHADRNSRMISETWLTHVAVPPDHIHLMAAEAGAVVAAREYASQLSGLGQFDLTLMGLGEDGHTASLFPGHELGLAAEAPDTLAVFDAPKPPAERVSLSGARLCRSREMLFLVSGVGKRAAIQRWRAGETIPAALIRPAHGVDVLVTPPLDAAD